MVTQEVVGENLTPYGKIGGYFRGGLIQRLECGLYKAVMGVQVTHPLPLFFVFLMLLIGYNSIEIKHFIPNKVCCGH